MARRSLARRRKRGPVADFLKKAALATERLLDETAQDPEAVMERGERAVVGLAAGIERAYRIYQEDPDKAKRALRNYTVQQLARVSKRELRKRRREAE